MSEFVYRHAVQLRRSDGTGQPDTGTARQLAKELLIEWAAARGGAPVDGRLHVEKWDFAMLTGYGMEFNGPLTEIGDIPEPSQQTRLVGYGVVGLQQLRGREEIYVTDDDLTKMTDAELAYHGLRLFTGQT